MKPIGFNKPYFTGKEVEYIVDAVAREKISGNGYYTGKCHRFFEGRYLIKKALLTSSCTDALEMAALLINTQPDDEIIMPSYTFVSTANAFVLRGAKIVFADCNSQNPNIDPDKLEPLITAKTKAIVVVHYAGVSCDMDAIMSIASRHKLFVIEDAAQAVESFYKNKPLGAIGHLGCFSFHETKNIISGEGGALLINDKDFLGRAEILWEKGTNRSAFFRGEVDKYSWIDVGSSFLPSEITAAFLYAQLQCIDDIMKKRRAVWDVYFEKLSPLKKIGIGVPEIPSYSQHNAHIFYIVCRSNEERNQLLDNLNSNGVNAIFHYLCLHKSLFYKNRHTGGELPHADRFDQCLLRLPLYYELTIDQAHFVANSVLAFFQD
jgi:dTDP-4-amino-4,6-dideoxygalactose transaminase